jgi:pantothenate kinase
MPLDLGDVVEKAVSLERHHQRVLIGLVGVPGAGKSTLAGALALAFLQRGKNAQVIPMDGFHFNNELLKSHGLLDRKGSPETFDVQGLFRLLQMIKTVNPTHSIQIPVYSREVHDPIADAVRISSRVRFIIVEGNYLYSQAPVWRDVSRLIDLKLFLDCPPEEARDRVIRRHEEGGLDLEKARQKYESVDAPNAQVVLRTRATADWII